MGSGRDGPPDVVAMPPVPSGEHHTVVVTDVEDFSSRDRRDEDRRSIRAGHMASLRSVLKDLWDQCHWNDRGDGLLMVVPPMIPTAEVIRRLHLQLPRELEKYNQDSRMSARFRLRVAVDVGPVMRDVVGVTGGVAIRATRLVNAMPLRNRMEASPGAGLGLIVSGFVYENVIRDAEDWAEADTWERVEVDVQGYQGSAWIRLIE